jgi:Uma2 family endonuclease
VYQPDVVFVSNQRRSIITRDGLEGAPDLVVEVLSPGTARLDRGSKRKIYARTGVKELWLADPETKLIVVYQLAVDPEAPAATYGVKAVFHSPLLPGLRIKASSLFKTALEV